MERLKHIVELNILLGAWLVVAPFVLGFSGSTAELWTDVAIGALLIGCSWWILAAPAGRVTAAVIQSLGALSLIATPFYFHYAKLTGPYTNDLIVGIGALIVSGAAMAMMSSRVRTA